MSEVNGVLSFLYCTLTGVGALLIVLMICGLVLAPIYGVICFLQWLAKSRPKLHHFGSDVLPVIVFFLLVGGVISFVVLAMHDWGCEIHGHPEHKILDKSTTPHDQGHKS